MASKRKRASAGGTSKKRKSRSDYDPREDFDPRQDVVFLSDSASKFRQKDIDALNVTFQGAQGKFDVIPQNTTSIYIMLKSLILL
jgi:hypothetical protein